MRTMSQRDRLTTSNVAAFGVTNAFRHEVKRLCRLGMSEDRALRFFKRVVG